MVKSWRRAGQAPRKAVGTSHNSMPRSQRGFRRYDYEAEIGALLADVPSPDADVVSRFRENRMDRIAPMRLP